jgi:hypothetical protein
MDKLRLGSRNTSMRVVLPQFVVLVHPFIIPREDSPLERKAYMDLIGLLISLIISKIVGQPLDITMLMTLKRLYMNMFLEKG